MSHDSDDQTQEQLQEVAEVLRDGSPESLEMIGALSSAELARVAESAPPPVRKALWGQLGEEQRAELLPLLGDEAQVSVLKGLASSEVAELTLKLEADDTADMLQQLPAHVISEVLESMDTQRRQRIERVLDYGEFTAGGLMNTDVVTVRARITLDVVFRYLRMRGQLPEGTDKLIVADRRNRYLGVLPLWTLAVSNQTLTVRDVMDSSVPPIQADAEASEVAVLFEKNNWLSAAVVNDSGELLGRITVDDVMSVVRETADKSLTALAGLREDEDTFAPLSRTAPRRALWLGVNLATAFCASAVIKLFDETLERLVALAVLMPVVASMGGVAGSQTLTIVVRGMAMGQIGRQNIGWLVGRECLIGLGNGVLWAVTVSGVAWLWFRNWQISAVLAAAMLASLLFASLSGALLPLILRAMRIDPAVAGSVVVTTFTDVVGFFSFLGLAAWVIN